MCPTTFLDSISNEHCRNLVEIRKDEKLTRLNKNNHYLDGYGIIAIIRATIYVVQWKKNTFLQHEWRSFGYKRSLTDGHFLKDKPEWFAFF